MLLNPAASRDVHRTPGVPALTFRARVSLSFVFLMLPAASHPTQAPGAPGLSLDPVSTLEFREMPGGARSRLTVSVCFLMSAISESAPSPVQVATATRHPNAEAPSPFRLSSNICVQFHGSPLRTSILSAGDVRF